MQKITLGELVNELTSDCYSEHRARAEAARGLCCTFTDFVCTVPTWMHPYSLSGRKIERFEDCKTIGVIGVVGIMLMVASILVIGTIWHVEGAFPHLMASIMGGTSAGLITLGFGVAGVVTYLSKKEKGIELNEDQVKKLLKNERSRDLDPTVAKNLIILEQKYGLSSEPL